MLVLTRRLNESVSLMNREGTIVIATVMVLGIAPDGHVRLGFDAPDSVKILRDNARRRTNGKEDSNKNGG